MDRRNSMMKAIDRRIIPGDSDSSRLILRLTGSEFGPQMPPTGALPPDQIATIRKWIDQGAEWPDALANEAELPPMIRRFSRWSKCCDRETIGVSSRL